MTGDRRVAVVTGAARGIGLATSRVLAARGHDIVAVDLDGASFDEVSAIDGAQVVTVDADVGEVDGWTRIVDACEQHFGRMDVLVNNAGIPGPTTRLVDYPIEEFDRVMAVNTRGVFLGVQMCAPMLERSGAGSIVNLSSILGSRAGAGVAGYTVSKHAVVGITRNAAVELAPHVRVNAVCPSPTDTDMLTYLKDHIAGDSTREEFERSFSSSNPMRRFAQPEEIATTIAFLAGPDSGYVTGAIVPVDGGSTAK